MSEWLIEDGIGETRCLLVEGETAVAAKLFWPGEPMAGEIRTARLFAKAGGASRGTATLANGTEVLVDRLPPDVTEGSQIDLLISRAPIAERGRLKRAQGRYLPMDQAAQEAADTCRPRGRHLRQFPAGLWEEVWAAASTGCFAFPGGEILVTVAPAMTVIDVDGDGTPRELALAAIPAIARAIAWFDLGGSIAVDFPTIEARADRKVIDEMLGEALADWPHERTAMNGFGLVQIVSRLEGPSLLHRFAASRTGMCARMALRRGEHAQGTGRRLLLTVHPAIKAKLKPEWLDELAQRTGKDVRIETNPALALEASQAQILER